jgi:hypothetical protein
MNKLYETVLLKTGSHLTSQENSELFQTLFHPSMILRLKFQLMARTQAF